MALTCSGTFIIQASSKTIAYAVLFASFVGLISIVNVTTLLNDYVTRVHYMGELVTNEFMQTALLIEPKPLIESLNIDIVSVGSLTKPQYQQAQQRTLGSHAAVRNFFPITELNDTDSTCSEKLSYPQLQKVKQFCKRRFRNQSKESYRIRRLLYGPKNHTGWMCAQKRPIDGLYAVLQQYQLEQIQPPNYLFIVDDDSFLNMDTIIHTLQTNHSYTAPSILTGCPYNYPQDLHFVFPYGGFATLLSQAALQRLVQPVYCQNTNDTENSFARSVCWRLQQNLMGELHFFRDGMSVGDLMYQYSLNLPFTNVDNWLPGTGFCFHSDHALGYFLGFYHIAVPENQFGLPSTNFTSLRYQYGYTGLAGESECKHTKRKCRSHFHMCHYVRPQQMDRLFEEQRKSLG
jgi:hypothetical protein